MSAAVAETSQVADPQLQVADPSALRRAMGRFTTGAAILMSETPTGPQGMTINSLTWVSLEPPLILISLTSGTRSAEAVQVSGAYSVSILGAGQESLAREFSRPGDDKFAGRRLHRGSFGQPVVPGALATLECTVEQEIQAGDHTIFLGKVRAVEHRVGSPLAFYSGKFGGFDDPEDDMDFWI
jgi:flavin reductase (DIM6/NTAB) family NADH-FMN oxidoreductase RutF